MNFVLSKLIFGAVPRTTTRAITVAVGSEPVSLRRAKVAHLLGRVASIATDNVRAIIFLAEDVHALTLLVGIEIVGIE